MKVQRCPIEYYLILKLAKMWRSIFKCYTYINYDHQYQTKIIECCKLSVFKRYKLLLYAYCWGPKLRDSFGSVRKLILKFSVYLIFVRSLKVHGPKAHVNDFQYELSHQCRQIKCRKSIIINKNVALYTQLRSCSGGFTLEGVKAHMEKKCINKFFSVLIGIKHNLND